MIPKAREVRLKPKVRKVLEARCRAPTTAQRDVRRARIVLLAAEGRSTRSIAAAVGVQPRIVSHWRRRFPGVILSMPMLAITKIICDRLQPLAAFGHFLEG